MINHDGKNYTKCVALLFDNFNEDQVFKIYTILSK